MLEIKDLHASVEGKGILKMTNEPRDIPKRERFNPALNETFEAVGPHLSN